MSLGINLNLGIASRLGGTSVAAAISSVDAVGWSATWASGTPPTFDPDNTPQTISATRSGYTTTGTTTTYSDSIIFAKRVRQVYPNSASLSANTVALSKEVYSTDTLAGVTNNSTLTSPKPIAAWLTPGRQVVGNSLALELLALHKDYRNGQPVACVVFSATDGSNTVTATVSTLQVLGGTYDKFAVLGYKTTLDITSLNAGQITVNAKVYPWFGGAASIQDSSTGSEGVRGTFNPLIFTKDTTLAASPRYCYVSLTGNDTTGVASTTVATAEASPCATYKGAADKIRATFGSTNGAIIRFMAGTHSTLAASTTADATTSEIILESDPVTGKAGVTISTGVSNWNLNQKFVRIRNLTLSRSGTFFMFQTGAAAGQISFDNCDITINAHNAVIANCGSGGGVWFNGVTVTGQTSTTLQLTASQNIRMIRGCSNGTGTGIPDTAFANAFVGNDLSGIRIQSAPTLNQDNTIVAFNRFARVGGTTGTLDINDVTDPSYTNIAIVQNVWEYISATASIGIRLSGDANSSNNMTHVLLWNNTFVGANDAGRANLFYDSNVGTTVRTHRSISVVGNIFVQDNIKTDYFVGVNAGDPTNAPLHIGNWAQLYGTGWAYNHSQYRNASGSDVQPNTFGHEYNGLKCNYSTSNNTRLDPLFTTYAGTTWNGTTYTAGAGGGVYTLQGGSPCKTKVLDPPILFDLTGSARSSTTASMGAYE